MTDYPLEGKRSPYILLSVLVHLLLLYAAYQLISYHKSSQNALEDPLQVLKQLQQEEIATLKPRQSAFGAPVIFQDMPEFLPEQAGNDIQDQDDNEPQETVSQTTEHAEVVPETLDKTVAQKVPDTVEQQDPIPMAQSTGDIAPESTQKQPSAHQSIAQRTAKRVAALREQIAHKTRQRMRKQRTTGQSTKIAAPITKKLTFKDLANGFLENLKQEGNDWVHRQGNSNKRPSYKDLKYMSYYQKLAWHLQAAFKRSRGSTTESMPEMSVLRCVITIDKNGDLQNLEILSPTGTSPLDKYIIATIKDAFPMPPIPDHWGKSQLRMPWSFNNVHPTKSNYEIHYNG